MSDGPFIYATKEERKNKILDIWTHASQEVASSLWETLKKNMKGFNPVYMMADSGARGSQTQIRQLAGMRGLMTKPGGEIIYRHSGPIDPLEVKKAVVGSLGRYFF